MFKIRSGLFSRRFIDPDNRQELNCLPTPGGDWDCWSLQARHRYESRFMAKHFQARLVEALDL
jgi:hypothetical protein